MNRDLTLRILGEVMNWPDERANSEYVWLDFMSRAKYDSYRDFQAGMRFVESLATWLQQFPKEEREIAYSFVRHRLVFIGVSETHHLVEQFFPRTVNERIVRTVAAKHGLETFEAVAVEELRNEMTTLRRKTLFLGLSDGARIDVLRHSNVGRLNNEQIVHTTEIDADKWRGLLGDLRKSVHDDSAQFEAVYLIDDFTATGTSFLRPGDEAKPWKGKLARFANSILPVLEELFPAEWSLYVHHYIASHDATQKIAGNLVNSAGYFSDLHWGTVEPSYGMVFPSTLPLSLASGDGAFIEMTDRYYDSAIETEHTKVGGVDRINLGYGGCALPVILEHNTPNNSVALLWAETDGSSSENAHAMRPLFRRRQRHVAGV